MDVAGTGNALFPNGGDFLLDADKGPLSLRPGRCMLFQQADPIYLAICYIGNSDTSKMRQGIALGIR